MKRLHVRFITSFLVVIFLATFLPFGLMAIIRNITPTPGPGEEVLQIMAQFTTEQIEILGEFFRRSILIQLSVFLAVGGLIGTIAGILLSRNLTAPIIKLTNAARAIGAKDLSRRVEVTGSEEIELLATSFNDMAAKLENAEDLRQNLLADVAHELRTPLTVIQGNLRAILDDVYPLEKEEIARLYEQTLHLTRLIEDLRELSHAEADRLPMNMVSVDVVKLVKETAVTFTPLTKAENITLRPELLGALPTIQADQARLRQSLHNLLNNAIQHTPAGGTITLQAEQIDNLLHLRVNDTGDGIPAEQLEHIFDRFARIEQSRSRDKGGSGLGLAIVRAIAHAHGGNVTATSPGPNQGSTITIKLPIISA
ncbi:MAG: HAMP domain-containing protein [Chloroflexi bacterium]|nr:MAG: HAMP domain-containing protein [Chloroflexota bacterium]